MNIDFIALGALGVAVLFIGGLVFLNKKKVDFGIRTIVALVFGLIRRDLSHSKFEGFV